MFTFAGRVLQGAFERENVSKLEEEISRLFRSNAFNISARRRAEEERLERYKELSEAPMKIEDKLPPAQRIKHTDQLIRKMEKKYSVPKVSERQSYRKAKTEIRPLYNRLTALGAQ